MEQGDAGVDIIDITVREVYNSTISFTSVSGQLQIQQPDLKDANERTEELMELVKLDKKHDTLAMNLTYAEQRALEIGITIAGGASVILLDEPTAGMSKSETSRFIKLIKDVTVGKTLLTVEHDMGVVFGLADKIAVVVYGELLAYDTPEAVRANQRVQEAYLGSSVADSQAQGH